MKILLTLTISFLLYASFSYGQNKLIPIEQTNAFSSQGFQISDLLPSESTNDKFYFSGNFPLSFFYNELYFSEDVNCSDSIYNVTIVQKGDKIELKFGDVISKITKKINLEQTATQFDWNLPIYKGNQKLGEIKTRLNIINENHSFRLKFPQKYQFKIDNHSKKIGIISANPWIPSFTFNKTMYVLNEPFLVDSSYWKITKIDLLSQEIEIKKNNNNHPIGWKENYYLDKHQFTTFINSRNISQQDVVFQNDYYLIYLWAPWCTHCKKTNKNIISNKQLLESKNVQVIGIADDSENTKDEITKYVVENGLYFPNSVGSSLETSKFLFLLSYPDLILLDKSFKIIKRGTKLDEILNLLEKTE